MAIKLLAQDTDGKALLISYDGVGTFLGLGDTPNSYTGQAGKILSIKSTEDGVEFIANTNIPVWNKQVLSVAAGATELSTEIVGASFVKYFVLAEGNSNAYAFEMNVFNASGNALDSISNKIGSMAVSVVSQIGVQGPYIEITNNELYNITMTITYMGN